MFALFLYTVASAVDIPQCTWRRQCNSVLAPAFKDMLLKNSIYDYDMKLLDDSLLNCTTRDPSNAMILESNARTFNEICSQITEYSSPLKGSYRSAYSNLSNMSKPFSYSSYWTTVETVIIPIPDLNWKYSGDPPLVLAQGRRHWLPGLVRWQRSETSVATRTTVYIWGGKLAAVDGTRMTVDGLDQFFKSRIFLASNRDMQVEECNTEVCYRFDNCIAVISNNYEQQKPVGPLHRVATQLLDGINELTGWLDAKNRVVVFWNGRVVFTDELV